MRCGARLAAGRGLLRLLRAFRCRPTRRMPIEDATVEWKESDSPYHAVARIRIPQQDVGDAETRGSARRGALQSRGTACGAPAARQHEPSAAGDLQRDGGVQGGESMTCQPQGWRRYLPASSLSFSRAGRRECSSASSCPRGRRTRTEALAILDSGTIALHGCVYEFGSETVNS